jgi:hypothetical protein
VVDERRGELLVPALRDEVFAGPRGGVAADVVASDCGVDRADGLGPGDGGADEDGPDNGGAAGDEPGRLRVLSGVLTVAPIALTARVHPAIPVASTARPATRTFLRDGVDGISQA